MKRLSWGNNYLTGENTNNLTSLRLMPLCWARLKSAGTGSLWNTSNAGQRGSPWNILHNIDSIQLNPLSISESAKLKILGSILINVHVFYAKRNNAILLQLLVIESFVKTIIQKTDKDDTLSVVYTN